LSYILDSVFCIVYSKDMSAMRNLVIPILLIASVAARAQSTADHVVDLETRSSEIIRLFLDSTLTDRLAIEYAGGLPAGRTETLRRAAAEASTQLCAVAEAQRRLKSQIENYRGDDWEDIYGSTGLWRRLFQNLRTTMIGLCRIDYYRLLAAAEGDRPPMAAAVIERLDSLDEPCPEATVIKAKTLLLAQPGPAGRMAAAQCLVPVTANQSPKIVYRQALLLLKRISDCDYEELDHLLQESAQHGRCDDIELNLSLALLQISRGKTEAVAEYLKANRPAAETLGEVILLRLAARRDFDTLTAFEAKLACEAARKAPSPWRNELTIQMAGVVPLRTPAVLRAAAAALQDSHPLKAVEMLIQASRLPRTNLDVVQVAPVDVARQAAELAYGRLASGDGDCDTAVTAVENLLFVAGSSDEISEETFIYAALLDRCGRGGQSAAILRNIADSGVQPWANKARLYLLAGQIAGHTGGADAATLEKLKELIDDLRRRKQEELLSESLKLYCRLLLEKDDRRSADKIIAELAYADDGDPPLQALKAEALERLQRHYEAAESMLTAVALGGCEHAGEAIQFLLRTTRRIECLARPENGSIAGLADICRKLARLCRDCTTGGQEAEAAMVLAELILLKAPMSEHDLREAETLLATAAAGGGRHDSDLARCRARLLTAGGQFEKAAVLWGRIAEGQRHAAAERPWTWWRAKYLQLHCWSRGPRADIELLLHNIEVLENSFADIPPPWKEKLRSLGLECKDKQKVDLARQAVSR